MKDFDDGTASCKYAWHRWFATDRGGIPFDQFGIAVVSSYLRGLWNSLLSHDFG